MIRTVAAFLAFTSTAAVFAPAAEALQDFQVGSRAKGMGGSYTAFGDDPVAIWTNPAGTATQNSQFAITYQSFTQYEADRLGNTISLAATGDPEQGLLDPPISPSFAGVVVHLGDSDLDMAVSIAYIRPFQIKYVYKFNDPDPIAPTDLLTQTDQQFSRIRAAYALSFRVSDSPFLRTIALGVAIDFVYAHYKEIDQNPDPLRDSQIFEDSESAFGFGVGLLLTAVETDTFRMDVGAAYNSSVDFHFGLDPQIYPVWDWPALASGGFAFYLGDGYPLRVTLDVQWIGWQSAVGTPAPGFDTFRNTVSYSFGAEYRFKIGEKYRLFTRAGVKSYDTPWKSAANLPAVGFSQLQIGTKGDRLEILTLGLGLYWTRKTSDGETRSNGIDLAVELLGETNFLFGLGFTYQFD
jgi:long-subunit fatty acid transport protein